MKKDVKISAVIITYNEEKNIDRCLFSLKDVVDEIVVVDSHSTDDTKAICEKYCVKFISHDFEGHIEQKNWAITQAGFPVVLSLDADEALTNELKSSILAVKKNWKFDGYEFNRLTNYCGHWVKYCGWYPDKKLRLWDKSKGKWGGNNPHDTFIMNEKTTIGFLKGDLLHYSFYSIDEHVKQVNYFSSIAASSYHSKGKKSNTLKILIAPKLKFVKCYLLKLGFLDGYYGYVISKVSAHETFLRYAKLKRLQDNF